MRQSGDAVIGVRQTVYFSLSISDCVKEEPQTIPDSAQADNQRFCFLEDDFRRNAHSCEFESHSQLQRIEECAFAESDLITIQVPSSVEVLYKKCFYSCKSLTSVTFESNSQLQRIEESAFLGSGLRTIEVPASVEVLCNSCFYSCRSLTSVTFESHSKLHRIEESAFAQSGLTDLLLPNSIHFLSGSAIAVSSLNTVSFWPGRCEFQVHEMFIEDIAGGSVIRYFGRSSAIVIESRIEILCESCFSNCRSLTSVTFESNSKLQRIEEYAFADSGLTTIQVPASVEVLCKKCFNCCISLTSVTFESNSKLQRIEESAFTRSGLTTTQVPASVEMLCKSCFSYCRSLTSVTFEANSKLREVAADCFEGSRRLHPIEYPPSLSEQSRTVVSRSVGAPSSSTAAEE
jgi:hypothetical protein